MINYLDRYEGSPAKKGDYILRNYEYKFNDKLEFTFGDSAHNEGWMIMDIYFNEYHIKTSDRVFWKCRNCENDRSTDYLYYEYRYVEWKKETEYAGDRLYFYAPYGNGTNDYLYKYYFDFVINDITDLYKGGVKGAFKVNNAFYSLGSQQTFEIYIYDPQDELELINFNVSKNFHVTGYDTLLADFNNYY